MQTSHRLLPVFAFLALAGPLSAGDDVVAPGPVAPDGHAAASEQDPAQKKMVKSQFNALKFREDWSGLADPDATTDHWFPEIKWIELAEGWSLTTGGEVRWMEKDDRNRNLLGTFTDHNEFSLLRMRVYGDLHIEDDARIFIEGIDASIHGNNDGGTPPPAANDRDNWDLLNLFIDLLTPDFYVRLGRFQMAYGAQRLIGPGDWANVPRTFEGGAISFKGQGSTTDVFITKPVTIQPRSRDKQNISRHFSGIYHTMKVDDTHNADAYFLALNDSDDAVVSGNGNDGKLDIYTVGGRYVGKPAPWDYDGELALQRGHWSNDEVRAWMGALAVGYTMPDLPGAPRVGIDLDAASGDDNSTDGTHGTFNQLFPSSHPYFGYLDLIGRQNIVSYMPNVRWKLGDTAWFRAAWGDFNLQNDSDALYNNSGAVSLIDTTGSSGNHVGHEWDFTLGWTPAALAPHSQFLFGYSYFNPGNFVENTGGGPRPQLLYVQYTFHF